MTRTIGLLVTVLSASFVLGAPGVVNALERNEMMTWAETTPSTLDPHQVRGQSDTYGKLNLYDALYHYVGNPPELAPQIATGHTVSDGGLKWEFTLRQGVKFHDGSELTADDVVYSFRRLLAVKKAPSAAFRPILKPDNVTAVGKYKVRFVLDKAYAPFLAAIPLAGIVNPRVVEPHAKNGDWGAAWLATHDAGSGPYIADSSTFVSYQKGRFDWFPDYFMGWPDRPIKRVNLRSVKEQSTLVLALIKGEVDATDTRISADGIERLKKEKGVRVVRDQSMRLFQITMNTKRPPFDNLHFRKALSYAFNYDGFIQGLRKGLVVRNKGPLPNNLWGYPKDLEGYTFDLEKAKAELAMAMKEGADIGRKLTIYAIGNTRDSVLTAQLFQSDLRKIGVTLEIKNALFPNLASMARRNETTPDMWTHWVSTYFVDPENWIGQMYDSQFHGTWKASAWYSNPAVDKMLRRARTTLHRPKRAEIYRNAVKAVVADAPAIWIYNSVEYRGLRDRVKGYTFSPVGGGAEFRNMSLSK